MHSNEICRWFRLQIGLLVSDFIQINVLDLKFESKPAILRSKE